MMMNKQQTWVYAYPSNLFDRNAKNEDILAAYESEDNSSQTLPVLKMTPEELAEKINDEMFNDQEYWLRIINTPESLIKQENDLREKIIADIIRMLKNEDLDSITFSTLSEDQTSVIWYDRHDFPNDSRVAEVAISANGLVITTEEGVTLYTDSDYGAYQITTLNDLNRNIYDTIHEHQTAKIVAIMGKYLHEKGYHRIEFDHKSYDTDVNIPKLVLDDKRQKVNWISIDERGKAIQVNTEYSEYIFELEPSCGTSLALIEDSLRSMGMEELLETAYYNTSESKDEPFDFFIFNQESQVSPA